MHACVCVTLLWKCSSHWSGLSVTNEPSGTVTGMRANSIVGVWVAHARLASSAQICVQLCVHACARESESNILCGQWSWGSCTPAIAPATVASANLLNCKAQGEGVKERPRPVREFGPAVYNALPGFVHSSTFFSVIVEQNADDMMPGSQPCSFSYYEYSSLEGLQKVFAHF